MFSRTILIYIVFTLGAFNLGLLICGITNNSYELIIVGLFVGFILWLPYLYWKRNKSSGARFEVYCDNPKPGLTNFVMSYLVFISSGVVAVGLVSTVSLSVDIKQGTLIAYHTARIRYSEFEEWKIQADDGSVHFVVAEDNTVAIGSTFRLEVGNNIFGYPRILNITPIPVKEVSE